jgi:hypothetical protein
MKEGQRSLPPPLVKEMTREILKDHRIGEDRVFSIASLMTGRGKG